MFRSQFLAKNVAIYAFFAGEIETFGNLTGVKDLMLYIACSKLSLILKYLDILNNL